MHTAVLDTYKENSQWQPLTSSHRLNTYMKQSQWQAHSKPPVTGPTHTCKAATHIKPPATGPSLKAKSSVTSPSTKASGTSAMKFCGAPGRKGTVRMCWVHAV